MRMKTIYSNDSLAGACGGKGYTLYNFVTGETVRVRSCVYDPKRKTTTEPYKKAWYEGATHFTTSLKLIATFAAFGLTICAVICFIANS